MRKTHYLRACCWLLVCVSATSQQTPMREASGQNNAATEREVRDFYDSYAEDLRQHRPEAIANRYDPRGVFLLGNGMKSLKSFAEVKDRYLTRWKGPKSFEWKDLSVEVLSPTAAAVLGQFNWQTASGETLSFSYTGVLIKHPEGWRIRVEDESNRPVKPAAP